MRTLDRAGRRGRMRDKEGIDMKSWMSWEGGVDLVASTAKGLAQPNVIVHVARMVHTPRGSSPAGMVLYQPDPGKPPAVMGFICPDPKLGAWFGPGIFAGTPFEKAPALTARIEVHADLPGSVRSRVEAGGHVFEATLSKLGPLELIHRPAGPLPFAQQGLEAQAAAVRLEVDGKEVALILPEAGLSGGPPAVWAPAGLYAR